MTRRSPISYYDPYAHSFYRYPVLRAPSAFLNTNPVPFSQFHPLHSDEIPYSAIPAYTGSHPPTSRPQLNRQHPAYQTQSPVNHNETETEAATHHRHRQSSVIHIPVTDFSNSSASEIRPTQAQRHRSPTQSLTAASAATKIQACFRGFAVRKRKPVAQLRLVSAISKELEALEARLRSDGFAEKVRASEKERLRFTESVMALLLRLDAIQGAISEVAARRKEAVRTAVRLQDAIDVIVNSESSSSKHSQNPVNAEADSCVSHINPDTQANSPQEDMCIPESENPAHSNDQTLKGVNNDNEQTSSLEVEGITIESSDDSSNQEKDGTTPLDKCHNLHTISEANADNHGSVSGSTSDNQGSVSDAPNVDGQYQHVAPGSSDTVLFQQLSQECNELKSLLSKLLIQACAQNKAIASLENRLDRLEKQHQNKRRSRKQGKLK